MSYLTQAWQGVTADNDKQCCDEQTTCSSVRQSQQCRLYYFEQVRQISSVVLTKIFTTLLDLGSLCRPLSFSISLASIGMPIKSVPVLCGPQDGL